jgi:acetylornithine aminotransferase
MFEHVLPVYDRLPICLSHGEGAWVWDTEGRQYLDAVAGMGVTALGHNHPVVTNAIVAQSQKLLHAGNMVMTLAQERLSQKLCQLSGMEKVFVANSGAEANETAFKLARLYGHTRGIETPHIIVCEGAFHGRTLATLSAGWGRKLRSGFEPWMPGFIHVPFNDVESVERLSNRTDIVGMMVEPIQGAGGIRIPQPDYLSHLRTLCDENGWLLMLDEIQTGLGRTGTFFAYQQANIQPDILTLAKALANGLPISACLTRGELNTLFHPGQHGSTFGGNVLACEVATQVLSYIEAENLPAQITQKGYQLLEALHALDYPQIQEIRGKGLLVGIELKVPVPHLGLKAAKAGLLVNVIADQVIRLLPPFIVTEEQIGLMAERLGSIFHDL